MTKCEYSETKNTLYLVLKKLNAGFALDLFDDDVDDIDDEIVIIAKIPTGYFSVAIAT